MENGVYDLRKNGIWLQHGWIGDDDWFKRNARDKSKFRSDERTAQLAAQLKSHGIKYVYPHLCPCLSNGRIAGCDREQTERFLDSFQEFDVIPWVGGVLDKQCHPASEEWRGRFVASVAELMAEHPRLAGVQVNIEPLPSGNQDFLDLLSEIKAALPVGKVLSVAAYPPPTIWHPHEEVHWDEPYFREVAKRVDQLAPMMYDTAIRRGKIYRHLMMNWTREVLSWAGDTEVLLGVPAYDDTGVGYHDPKVENLKNAIRGINSGLGNPDNLPANYSGIAIYSEWEMDADEWRFLETEFERK